MSRKYNLEVTKIITTMKISKSKNIPQILFEKDLPQLGVQSNTALHFDKAAIITMLLAAAILTFTSWFVLERMFGEDFMEG